MPDNKKKAVTVLCNHCQYKSKTDYVRGNLQVYCKRRGWKNMRTKVCRYYRAMDEKPETKTDLLSWCD